MAPHGTGGGGPGRPGGASVDRVFERFTDRARRVLVLAQEEARLLGHDYIGTEHLFLALLHEGEGVAGRVLATLGVTLVDARDRVRALVGPTTDEPKGSPPFTPRAKKVLELSLREAIQLGHDHIGTEHLLLGLVREGEGVAAQALVGMGQDLPLVREGVLQALSTVGGPAGSAGPVDAPACPRCRSPLAETAAYRMLDVPSADGLGEVVKVAVLYCRACGTALGS